MVHLVFDNLNMEIDKALNDSQNPFIFVFENQPEAVVFLPSLKLTIFAARSVRLLGTKRNVVMKAFFILRHPKAQSKTRRKVFEIRRH